MIVRWLALTVGAASFLASISQKDIADDVLKRPNYYQFNPYYSPVFKLFHQPICIPILSAKNKINLNLTSHLHSKRIIAILLVQGECCKE